MNRKKDVILKATEALTENYKKEELFMPKNNRELPSRAAIIDVVKQLRSVIFPGYFWNVSAAKIFPEHFAGYRLNDLYDMLKGQIEIALLYANPELEQDGAQEEADRICAGFFEQLPDVQQRLLKDVQAGFDGDPAAKSKEEIISSYVVNDGIMNCLNEIAAEMKTFLERIPPQISYHIAKQGIYITGGSTRLPYIDKYLASYTGFTFNLSDFYETSAVTGLEKIIRNKELREWAVPVTQRKL